MGLEPAFMEPFWNYWDFRVESSEDVYFNAHLESVKNCYERFKRSIDVGDGCWTRNMLLNRNKLTNRHQL